MSQEYGQWVIVSPRNERFEISVNGDIPRINFDVSAGTEKVHTTIHSYLQPQHAREIARALVHAADWAERIKAEAKTK